MLQIHERQDTNGYEDKVQGISYPCIVESIADEGVNGWGVYSADESGIVIHDFESSQWEIIDGVIRTVLFKGLLAGINRCTFCVKDNEKNEKLLKLGFIKKDANTIEDINYFMNNCKKCKELK